MKKHGTATMYMRDATGVLLAVFEGPVTWTDEHGLVDDAFWASLANQQAPEWFPVNPQGPNWRQYTAILRQAYTPRLRRRAFICAVARAGPLSIDFDVRVPDMVVKPVE